MNNIKQDNDILKIKSDNLYITVEAYGNGIRFYATKNETVNDYMPVLMKTNNEQPLIVLDNNRAVMTNKNTKFELESSDAGLVITFFNNKNEKLIEANISDFDFEHIDDNDYRLKAEFQAPENEKLFGMGQYQNGRFDLKNSTLPLFQENKQVSIPYVISSKGYGFFWHNPSIGQAEFTNDKMIWTADCTEKLDFWVVAEDTPKDLVREYSNVTGKAPVMPEYAMGFWQSRLRYWNQEQLLDVAREYKKRNIPLDIIVCDFYHYPTLGDMKFDSDLFPNPKEMVDELKAMGTQLVISFWPHTEVKSDTYREMKEKNLLAETEGDLSHCDLFGTTAFFDMSNPETVEYVWEKCKKNYYDNGIHLFWLDEIEPTLSRKSPECHRLKAGKYQKIANLYPLLCEKAFYDSLTQEGETEIVSLSRCAWAGSQKYGSLVWSGDIDSKFDVLARQIVAGQQIGIAGIPWWNTDIGGFFTSNPQSPEFKNLLVRWFEYGAFCPVMRLHGDRAKDYIPEKADGTKLLFSGQPNEIWSYGKRVERILTKYIQIRNSMKPYTKQLFEQAHKYGDPIIRTLFYEFPDDENCWSISDEYMYGGDMLVAPITEQFSTKRTVYLPKGARWQSAINGKTFVGGQTVKVSARLDQIPVFLRNGNQYDLVKQIGE